MNTGEQEKELKKKIEKLRKTLEILEIKIGKTDEKILFHTDYIKKLKDMKIKFIQEKNARSREIEISQTDLLRLKEISFENINIDKLISLINSNKEALSNDLKKESTNESGRRNENETSQSEASLVSDATETNEPSIIIFDSPSEVSTENNE